MFKRLLWLCAALCLFVPEGGRAQGSASDDALVRILRSTNNAQLNSYVVKVYTLQNVNPFAVMRFMRRSVQAEDGVIFTFVGPGGDNGRVLVAIPEFQIESMDNLIASIDRAGLTSDDGTTRIYRQLNHRRMNIDPANPDLDDSAFISTFGVYLTGNDARIMVDPEQNAIFIEDAPSGADYLDAALMSDLDTPSPQVVFNTKIYELDLTNNSRIGLDYLAWKNGPGASLFAVGAFNEMGRVSLRNGSSALLSNTNGIALIPPDGELPFRALRGDFRTRGYNFAYRYEFHSQFFDYLAVRGKARVLTSARIAALNTRPASLTAGDQILYYAIQTTDPSGIRPSGAPFASNIGRSLINSRPAEFANNAAGVNVGGQAIGSVVATALPSSGTPLTLAAETGISIDLTPLIYDNGVDVDIVVTMTDYNGFDDTGFPRLNSRTFATNVRLGEGEEIILGGLTRESHVKATTKIPFLGSLPLIGSLFGGESSSRRQTEIVFSIKVEEIVRFDGGGYGISSEDQAIIDQADGSAPIEGPPSTWGFDMWGLDISKEPFVEGVHHIFGVNQ